MIHPDDNIKQRAALRAKHPEVILCLDLITGKASLEGKGIEWHPAQSYHKFNGNAFTQLLTNPPPKGKILVSKRIPAITYILTKQHNQGLIEAGSLLDESELVKFKLKSKTKIYLA